MGAVGWFGLRVWGWGEMLNMKMELLYLHPKLDYTVATHLALRHSFGTNNKKRKLLFIMEIGVFITPRWSFICIVLFFFLMKGVVSIHCTDV